MAKQIKEINVLIAQRVPPGDRWSLINEDTVHKSLTETLEAYFQNHSKLEFYLQLDKAITEEFLGETVSFRRVCEHMRNKQSYLWDEIVVRNQTLCSVLG